MELSEKNGNAQPAREVEVALPIELKFEEQLSLIRNYIEENFVSKGMCADLAIHNPHAHILLTMRPLDENGNWQAKSQKCYHCRKDNEEKSLANRRCGS